MTKPSDDLEGLVEHEEEQETTIFVETVFQKQPLLLDTLEEMELSPPSLLPSNFSPEDDIIAELENATASGIDGKAEAIPLIDHEVNESTIKPSDGKIDISKLVVKLFNDVTSYMPAASRIFLFRRLYPTWRIKTTIVEYVRNETIPVGDPRNTGTRPIIINGFATFLAEVFNEEGELMGCSHKTWDATKNVKVSFLEAAETGAVSRAIAMATGIGVLCAGYDVHEGRLSDSF